jgi:hypothetical protein
LNLSKLMFVNKPDKIMTSFIFILLEALRNLPHG